MNQQPIDSGIFPDVAALGDQLFVSYVGAGQIRVRAVGGAELYAAPCGGTGFSRLRAIAGELILAYRGGDGRSITVRNLATGLKRTHTRLEDAFYNWPHVLGSTAYAIDDLGRSAPAVQVYDYGHALIRTDPAIPGSGFAWMEADYVTNDQNRAAEFAYGILNPQYAGPVFCGEMHEGGGVGVVAQGKRLVINPGTDTFMPRITAYTAPEGPRWAITTGDYSTVILIDDLSLEDIVGHVNPGPDPVPGYNPKPDLIDLRGRLSLNVADLTRIIDKL